jgi:uncharacterized membrane protein YdbT with pleckstrin-like domain
MGYVERSLMAGEEVEYETWLHWIIYVPGVIFIPLFGLGFLLLLLAFINRRTSEFAVTNKRVIVKIGWISRRTIEMSLTKVESIDVVQGILGRVLGYGTILVVGTGSTKEPFKYIDDPLGFRRAVQEQSHP